LRQWRLRRPGSQSESSRFDVNRAIDGQLAADAAEPDLQLPTAGVVGQAGGAQDRRDGPREVFEVFAACDVHLAGVDAKHPEPDPPYQGLGP